MLFTFLYERAVAQLAEVFRLGSRWRPWKFSSDVIILSAFCSPGVNSDTKQKSEPRNFLGGEVRLARAVVVPNVKLKMEAQHSIPRLSLEELYGKLLRLLNTKYPNNYFVLTM